MINTFNLKITFADGSTKEHRNISRVAVDHYRQYYIDGLLATHIVITPYVKSDDTSS